MKRFVWLAPIIPIAAVLVIVGANMWASARYAKLPDHAKAQQILVEKSQRRLSLLDEQGKVLKSYRVSLGFGGEGAKRREGDGLTPEGVYKIAGRNPRSGYHLSLRVSYPSPADTKRAQSEGVSPGSDIMIHGVRNYFGWVGPFQHLRDWTAGCIAVTNRDVEEIWRAVDDGTRIEIVR